MLIQLHNTIVCVYLVWCTRCKRMYMKRWDLCEKKLHLVWGVHYPVWPARQAAWRRCCYEPGGNVGLTCNGASTSKQWVENMWLLLLELWMDVSCDCVLHTEKGRQVECTGIWPCTLHSTLWLSAGTSSNTESHPEIILVFSACIIIACLSFHIGFAHIATF
jgi:hypothetical protein